EFLAGDADTTASANDMAVFEEMMGAVLETPASPVVESESAPEPLVELEPEPEPEPEPESEPQTAFEADYGIDAETLVDSGTHPTFDVGDASDDVPSDLSSDEVLGETTPSLLEDMSAEPTFETWSDPSAALEGSPDEPLVYEFDFTTTPDQEAEPIIVPAQELPLVKSGDSDSDASDDADLTVVDGALDALRAELALEAEELQLSSTGSLTGDLERDLMSLGLGELPTSVYSEAVLGPDASDDTELVSDVSEETGAEAFSELAALTEQRAEDPAEDPHSVTAESESLEFDSFVPDLPEEVAPSVPDLSDILESLDSIEGLAGDLDGAEPGDDEPAMPTQSMGVISTDAFLADIAGEDLGAGLSGGLGDELSALTGLGGSKRPTASVNRIPEAGSPLEIHRDHAVDKDLVLKIIEGIKGL
ncbi:MAG: hypothetical protein Q8K89_05205, partial [Actinomycetota bacterium]|nr:hypothetical protein [Actinomycetota bacterium]